MMTDGLDLRVELKYMSFLSQTSFPPKSPLESKKCCGHQKEGMSWENEKIPDIFN